MDSSVERWLGRLSPSTGAVSVRHLSRWIEWVQRRGSEWEGVSPNRLIEIQKAATGDERFTLLDLAQAWVSSVKGRGKYKGRLYSSIRSFFLHNRADLPQDGSFRIRSDEPRVSGNLSIDEFRMICETSSPMYRALFVCMFQGGMGIGEAIYWSEHGLESVKQQLRSGSFPLIVRLPGRKKLRNDRPYYTFIGSDGVEALSHWLKVRPDVDNPHIFLTSRGTPISYFTVQGYWMRRLKRLGLIIGKRGKSARYGKNLHEVRDLFRTRWEKSGASGAAAEYFLGHVVDPMEYNKAFRDEGYAKREYRKAEEWLNVFSEDPESVSINEVSRLRQKIEDLEREKERKVDNLEVKVNELTEMLKILYENPELAAQLKKQEIKD